MTTLLAIQDLLVANVAAGGDFLLAQSSQGLVDTIRNFVGPILMLVTGIAAMAFLYQRQMTQFIIFAVIAVAVFAIFYAPEILKNLGETFGRNNSNW